MMRKRQRRFPDAGGRGADGSRAILAGCAVLAAAAAILLAGCGKKEPERTEITLLHGWGTMEEDHVMMRRIYEDFEKENPDVHINFLSMPSSQEAVYKANDLLAVGEIPDLVFTGGIGKDTLYRFMVEKDYAVDFSPYMEEDAAFAQDVAPVIRRYWETEEGRLFTISDVLLYSGGYWYNEDIFREAGVKSLPVDWEEFMAVCERIALWAQEENRDVIPIQLNGENSMYLTDLLLLDAGEDSRKAILDHRIDMNQAEFGGVLDQLKALNELSRRNRADYGYRDVLKLFNEGKAAMYLNGVWASSMIEEGLPVSYAPLPSAGSGSVSCVSPCLGYMVGNTGDAAKTEAAVRFVKYMISDRVQERIMRETGQVPSNPRVQVQADGMPRYQQAVKAVTGADIYLQVPDNIWDNSRSLIFKDRIMEVLNGDLSKQTFMDLLR